MLLLIHTFYDNNDKIIQRIPTLNEDFLDDYVRNHPDFHKEVSYIHTEEYGYSLRRLLRKILGKRY